MKHLKTFEALQKYVSGDIVIISYNDDIAKVSYKYKNDNKYILYSLSDDKKVYDLTASKFRKATLEEIEDYNIKKDSVKYNI